MGDRLVQGTPFQESQPQHLGLIGGRARDVAADQGVPHDEPVMPEAKHRPETMDISFQFLQPRPRRLEIAVAQGPHETTTERHSVSPSTRPSSAPARASGPRYAGTTAAPGRFVPGHHHGGVHGHDRGNVAGTHHRPHLIDHRRHLGKITGLELMAKPGDGRDRPREWVRVPPGQLDGSIGPALRLGMGRPPHRDRHEHRRGDARLDPFRRKRWSVLHDVVEQRDPAVHGDQDALARCTRRSCPPRPGTSRSRPPGGGRR